MCDYLALQRREQIQLTDFYNESCKYFEDKYENVKWTVCPKIDAVSRENNLGQISCEAEVLPAQLSMQILMAIHLRSSRKMCVPKSVLCRG